MQHLYICQNVELLSLQKSITSVVKTLENMTKMGLNKSVPNMVRNTILTDVLIIFGTKSDAKSNSTVNKLICSHLQYNVKKPVR